MLLQDRIIKVLKDGSSMSIRELQTYFESKRIKTACSGIKAALIQLERFEVVSLVVVENEKVRAFGYKLNDNYKAGLALQAQSTQRHMARTKKASKPKKLTAPVVAAEYGPWCQTGEPARLQVMFNELLAKPRAKRIKRGLSV